MDDIVRKQLDSISKLIDDSLKRLAEEQFGPSYEKPVEENQECKIIQFPINRRT